jgi:protein-disulfide isomerase
VPTLKIPVTADDHVQGKSNAAVTLVEYGDYECPHCGHAYPIVQQLQEHFGSKLRVVYRNFPLRELHPNAQSAAESAEFAGAHDKFWEMHDLLFENQEQLGGSLYLALAKSLSLSPKALVKALEGEEYAEKVSIDFNGGVRSGVNGTPTFFVNGVRHDASFEFEFLAAAIEKAMRPAKKTPRR